MIATLAYFLYEECLNHYVDNACVEIVIDDEPLLKQMLVNDIMEITASVLDKPKNIQRPMAAVCAATHLVFKLYFDEENVEAPGFSDFSTWCQSWYKTHYKETITLPWQWVRRLEYEVLVKTNYLQNYQTLPAPLPVPFSFSG